MAITAAALLAATAAVAGTLHARADLDTVGSLEFGTPLRVPPLMEPARDADGHRLLDLRVGEGRAELVRGVATPTLGGERAAPDPRSGCAGATACSRACNDLPEVTTTHRHGMHLPARADGGPHRPIAPGAAWSPSWTVDQAAATLWYHPHPHGATEDHVARGVAGMIIVDDARAGGLALPGGSATRSSSPAPTTLTWS